MKIILPISLKLKFHSKYFGLLWVNIEEYPFWVVSSVTAFSMEVK